MIWLNECLPGCTAIVLCVLLYYLLLGPVATLVVTGVQLLVAGWFVYTRIRAPD